MKTSDSIAKLAPALLAAQKETPESMRHLESVEIPRLARLFPNHTQTVFQRFMSWVAYGSSDCWFWYGSTDALGYGRMKAEGESKAHRVSWVLHNGPIPQGMHVLHKCDVRNCVNPNHLTLGTHADNMRDMSEKGRVVNADIRGEKNPMAKANNFIVSKIRELAALGEKQARLAKEFGLSPMAVSRIVRMETWK